MFAFYSPFPPSFPNIPFHVTLRDIPAIAPFTLTLEPLSSLHSPSYIRHILVSSLSLSSFKMCFITQLELSA